MPSALAVLRLIDRLILGRRLHREIARFLPLEDTINITGSVPVLVHKIRPVREQATTGDEVAFEVNHGQLMFGRKHDD